MKKYFLFFSVLGAIAPYALYLTFLPSGSWKSIFSVPSGSSPLASFVYIGVGAQMFAAAMALLWAVWNHPKLSPTHKWTLTALTLALSPACGLPFYFYLTWDQS